MLTATPKVSSARSALPAIVSSRLSKTGATVTGVLGFPSRMGFHHPAHPKSIGIPQLTSSAPLCNQRFAALGQSLQLRSFSFARTRNAFATASAAQVRR